jgi:hypothetical protein
VTVTLPRPANHKAIRQNPELALAALDRLTHRDRIVAARLADACNEVRALRVQLAVREQVTRRVVLMPIAWRS